MSLGGLAEVLGVNAAGEFRINDVQFVQWGRDLIFSCEYRADERSIPLAFQLVFNDCRELKWKTYAHTTYESPVIPSTPLVDFSAGQGNHPKTPRCSPPTSPRRSATAEQWSRCATAV